MVITEVATIMKLSLQKQSMLCEELFNAKTVVFLSKILNFYLTFLNVKKNSLFG
jgi:hypothetical protein